MPDPKHYDLVILGAGIAGLSVAFSAIQVGMKTAVLDRLQPGSGASGAPKALLNPATGRKAKKTWNAEQCLIYSKTLLKKVQDYTGDPFYTDNGVVRPALDEKLAETMYQTFTETRWPDEWIEWLDSGQLNIRFPGLCHHYGGLWIPAGGTVAFGQFIRSFCIYLRHHGAEFYLGTEATVDSAASIWQITTKKTTITAGSLVYATGEGLLNDPCWEMLSLNRVKGQTLTVQLQNPLLFKSSVSSLGYIAQQGDRSGNIVLGSTYEHDFDHSGPDNKGADYLLDRLERTLPDIHRQIRSRDGWAGIRVTTDDKKPFIGRHPKYPHMFAIGALGSKGLMLGPWLGKRLVEHIQSENEVPDIFRIERLFR